MQKKALLLLSVCLAAHASSFAWGKKKKAAEPVKDQRIHYTIKDVDGVTIGQSQNATEYGLFHHGKWYTGERNKNKLNKLKLDGVKKQKISKFFGSYDNMTDAKGKDFETLKGHKAQTTEEFYKYVENEVTKLKSRGENNLKSLKSDRRFRIALCGTETVAIGGALTAAAVIWKNRNKRLNSLAVQFEKLRNALPDEPRYESLRTIVPGADINETKALFEMALRLYPGIPKNIAGVMKAYVKNAKSRMIAKVFTILLTLWTSFDVLATVGNYLLYNQKQIGMAEWDLDGLEYSLKDTNKEIDSIVKAAA